LLELVLTRGNYSSTRGIACVIAMGLCRISCRVSLRGKEMLIALILWPWFLSVLSVGDDTITVMNNLVFSVTDDAEKMLPGNDISTCNGDAAVDMIAATQQIITRMQALQLRAIHRLSVVRGKAGHAADEVALELTVSRQAGQSQVAFADALCTRLPKTLSALHDGDIDAGKARKVFDVVSPLSDELTRQVDDVIAGRLAGKDPAGIRRIARTAVLKVDPDGALHRAEARREDRRVELLHEDDAMATLTGYLPAEVASAGYRRIDGIARGLNTREETRSMDQLRADVFADLLVGQTDHGTAVAAQVFVHIPIGTALGITQEGCELAGHGPIPGALGREIMNNPNSIWRTVLTDPASGAVLDVGRRRYRPPPALADLVHTRDRECRMPGCHRPAQVGDIDHHQPWAYGGNTNATNLNCFCRHHHRLKDQPGWNYTIDPATREFTVTTPTRRRYGSSIRHDCPQQTTVEKTDHVTPTAPTPRSRFGSCTKTTTQPAEPSPLADRYS
jgi:hypothetical protein